MKIRQRKKIWKKYMYYFRVHGLDFKSFDMSFARRAMKFEVNFINGLL